MVSDQLRALFLRSQLRPPQLTEEEWRHLTRPRDTADDNPPTPLGRGMAIPSTSESDLADLRHAIRSRRAARHLRRASIRRRGGA